jgi:hypothetical protein
VCNRCGCRQTRWLDRIAGAGLRSTDGGFAERPGESDPIGITVDLIPRDRSADRITRPNSNSISPDHISRGQIRSADSIVRPGNADASLLRRSRRGSAKADKIALDNTPVGGRFDSEAVRRVGEEAGDNQTANRAVRGSD